MHIKDELVKNLSVLPLTFSLIAFFSAISSIIYSYSFGNPNSALINITRCFMVTLFLIGILLWYRFDQEVERLEWNGDKSGGGTIARLVRWLKIFISYMRK